MNFITSHFLMALVTILTWVHSSANEETSNYLRRTQGVVPAEGCPVGLGFNYQSTEPYCKINFKCADGKFEFSTKCGCGCQPVKCGGSKGECREGFECIKGACFKRRRTQGIVPAEGCPVGFGFNYWSTEPFCKINFKCAPGKFEFSTPCGCGCQPVKCGGSNGECPEGFACNKGACFKQNKP